MPARRNSWMPPARSVMSALRNAGVPAVSLKIHRRWRRKSDDFCYLPSPTSQSKPALIQRPHKHVDLVCSHSVARRRERSPDCARTRTKGTPGYPRYREATTGSTLQAYMTPPRFARLIRRDLTDHRHRGGETPRLHRPREVTNHACKRKTWAHVTS